MWSSSRQWTSGRRQSPWHYSTRGDPWSTRPGWLEDDGGRHGDRRDFDDDDDNGSFHGDCHDFDDDNDDDDDDDDDNDDDNDDDDDGSCHGDRQDFDDDNDDDDEDDDDNDDVGNGMIHDGWQWWVKVMMKLCLFKP